MLFGGCEDALLPLLLLLVGSERDWEVGGNCNVAGGGGRAPLMVGRMQLGEGRGRVGRVRDWGGGGGLGLVLHRQEEVGADGKLGRQVEVAAGRVGRGGWGRQGGSLPRRGSRGWGQSGQSTGPTFAFAPRQALKSSAQPIHHTGRQGRRLQGRGKLLHEQCTDPSGEPSHCQTPQCLCAAGRGSRWTGRGSLTPAETGLS